MSDYIPRSSDEYIKSIPTQKQLDLLKKLGYGDCSHLTRQKCQKYIHYHLEAQKENYNNIVDYNYLDVIGDPFECYLNNN